MKKVLFFGSLCFSTLIFSQVRFEKGYVIDSDGQRKECLIKNEDLRENPATIEYKLSENSAVQTGNVYNLKSFEIYDKSSYVSAKVDLDLSSDNLRSLSTTRVPEYKASDLFLKVLVDGKYDLYKYSNGNQNRFFFSDNTGTITPLVYKAYEIETNKVSYNETYKTQLLAEVKCAGSTNVSSSGIDYSESSLRKYFVNVNRCSDPDFNVKTQENNKGKFNLYVKPKINFSSLEFQTFLLSEGVKLDSNTGLGIGVELEYVASINRNKWAVIFEPNFYNYKTENTLDVNFINGGKIITNAEYKSLDLPIGIRHYLFINDRSKIFLNASVIPNFSFGSSFEQRRANGELLDKYEVGSTINYGFGLGYNYNSKFSVEARYNTPRGILKNGATSSFKMVSLSLGYNIF